MIPKVKFVVLVLLLLPPVPLSLDLDCLKEMSSADGICLLNDNCCRSKSDVFVNHKSSSSIILSSKFEFGIIFKVRAS